MSRDHAKPLSRPAGECCDTPLVFVQANRLCVSSSQSFYTFYQNLFRFTPVSLSLLSVTQKKQQYFPIVLLHNKSFQIAK